MLRHQPETELSEPWGEIQVGVSRDGVGIAQGGGELWFPSHPEMGTLGKVGGRGLAKTRNQGQEGCLGAGSMEAWGAESVGCHIRTSSQL